MSSTVVPVNIMARRLKVSGATYLTIGYVKTAMTTPAPMVPMFSAVCGSPPSLVLTRNVPAIENRMPAPAMTRGSRTRFITGLPEPAGTMAVAASTIALTIAPT